MKDTNLREIRDIRHDIQNARNSQAEWTCYLQSTDWVFHIVHDVVDVRPTSVGENDFEHGRGVLVYGVTIEANRGVGRRRTGESERVPE